MPSVLVRYAPTMSDTEEVKDKFYEDLEAAVPKEGKYVVLDDVSTRTATDYQTWESLSGTEITRDTATIISCLKALTAQCFAYPTAKRCLKASMQQTLASN